MTALVLEPVDRVVVTTVVDNTADMVLPDVGLVRRWGLPAVRDRSRSCPATSPSAERLSTSSGPSTNSPGIVNIVREARALTGVESIGLVGAQ